jgi:Ca2+-binding RTX toxin-like protein
VEVLTAAGASAIDLTGNELANTLIGNGDANVLDGGAGIDRLEGDAGRDRLFGDAGKDTVVGGSGNDVVGGGSGKDKLYGGKGKFSRDMFVFDTKLKSAKVAKYHADKIYDFGPKYDSLGFDNAVFKNKTIASYVKKKHGATLDHQLKIDKHWFQVGDKALDRNDFFIYNDKTHKLYFDADGSGHKAMVEVASFSHFEKHAGTHLTYKDFFLI